jgi:hypothetical protein
MNTMPSPASVTPAGNYETTRFNAMQHGEAGEEHLDHVFNIGAQRILATAARLEQRVGRRR